MVGAGAGNLHASPSAVLPMVSRFTRVCAYDRPGTRIEGLDASTPIGQPHKLDHAVLSADKPWPSVAPGTRGTADGSAAVTFADWLAAQDLLAASLSARHVKATHSGHHIHAYQPQLVVDAIREAVDTVRSKKARRSGRYGGTGWSGVSSIEMAVTISLLGWMSGGEAGLSDMVADSAMPVVVS